MKARVFAWLSLVSLLSVAAPSKGQAPAGASTATFPGADPAAPAPAPAPLPPAPPPPEAPVASPAAPPASATAAPAPAPAPPAPVAISEPPPPPPRSLDGRPIRSKRPLFIGGELGWNGLAGFGVNFSYHPIPYLAFDAGLGLAFSGPRLGLRARANFLTSEWTPLLGVGMTYSPGSGGEEAEAESSTGEKFTVEILPSGYVQLVGGVNYTGDEGFVFMATGGYAFLLDSNTSFGEGSREGYEEFRNILRGGVVISLAFGYAF
jgi:hypothetical protein